MQTQVLEHAAIIGQGLDSPCYVLDLGCDDAHVQVGGIELSGVAAGGGAASHLFRDHRRDASGRRCAATRRGGAQPWRSAAGFPRLAVQMSIVRSKRFGYRL